MTDTPLNRWSILKGVQMPLAVTVLFSLLLFALALAAYAALSTKTEPLSQAAAANGIDHFAQTRIEGKAAIVVDIMTGKTLYEKNADAQLPLASLAKVALALVIAETLPLDSKVTIPHYIGAGASPEHLSKGEEWLVRDVMDFTLVTSSNSGAEFLARLADPALRDRFPEAPKGNATLVRMNNLAKELGLSQTFFLNVNGLDLSTTQSGAYGSARDMASLFAYAASSDPSLFAGTTRRGVLLTGPDGVEKTVFNTNVAQGTIPGLIMGKTGITDLAGGNLAVVFDVSISHPVVAVVLGSSENGRFDDVQKLSAGARRAVAESPINKTRSL